MKLIIAKIAVQTDEADKIPHLFFDQLCHIKQLLIVIRSPANETNDAFLNFSCTELTILVLH